MSRWILGDEYNVEILREFSATSLIGRIFPSKASGFPHKSLTAEEIEKKGLSPLDFSGHFWEIRYLRKECDETNLYCAVVLELVE